MNKNYDCKCGELHLGGCYHTGLAYALGYDANGELELCSKLFTTLDSGIDGGARAALDKHRRLFCPNRDVEQFIVSLQPVEILHQVPESPDDIDSAPGCSHCEEKADEDCCCHNYDECDEECCTSFSCGDDNEDDFCLACHEYIDYCTCDDGETCLGCEELFDNCSCDDGYEDELCQELVSETFQPMNAFARARWMRAQQKGN